MVKVKRDPKYRGVFWVKGRKKWLPATLNLTPGVKFYEERVLNVGGKEYRLWNPSKSKPAIALIKGSKHFKIKPGDHLLYLGIASGTTASHFSDIIGVSGLIYGVDVSQRSVRRLLKACSVRKNIIPLLEDASRPEEYRYMIDKVDGIYCDVSQPNQTEILLRNCSYYLNSRGYVMMAVKASSIDATLPPKKVFNAERKKLEDFGLNIQEEILLAPYARKHIMFIGTLP